MASDYGQRGQAAMRLLKGGKKGGPPPEEDLGLPPEDGAAPPEGGAAPPMDLAAMMGGGGMPPPPPGAGGPAEGPGGPPMPEDGMDAGQPQDLDTALGSVEASLEGLPPEAAEEIREHLNAIREIAAGGGGKAPDEAGKDTGMNADTSSTPPPVAPAREETAG